jgi:membrane protease YdiL (CAAX protease family)
MHQVLDVEAPMKLSSTTRRSVAPAWHTILVLIVIAASAVRGLLRTSQIGAGLNLDRITLYERTLLFEWLLLGLVLFGVWLKGGSLFEVLGDRWRSGKQILRDVGLAVAFLIASIMITSMIGGHGGDANKSIQFLLPQTGAERALWVLLSISAGICEEAVYRGYFQKQFMALTNNVPAGIGLAALTFAGSHLYQGWARAAVIGVMAVLGGVLAHWCRSVRPGMIAHVMQDVLGGFVQH